jgi:hypothetical protein
LGYGLEKGARYEIEKAKAALVLPLATSEPATRYRMVNEEG